MCATCGCGQSEDEVKILIPGEDASLEHHTHDHHSHDDHHHHHHDHDHHHSHSHDHHHHSMVIDLEKDVLHENNLLAERNRGFLEAKKIIAFNLVSSPGSGKTTLLEKTVRMMKSDVSISIIEGDQQSMNDADRIAATGVPVVQVNTGKGCHLDAHMVLHAIKKLQPKENSVLFIENVGNLVCPSMFDLGENKRVVIMSVTEGEDKPLKYPHIFASSQLCIINKTDLLPYLQFDVERSKEYALRVNHHLEFIEVSAQTGEGMEKWISWIRNQVS